MIDDIKVLIPNADDKIINIYIRKSITLIQNYLNNDKFTKEYVEENFSDAIIDMVVNAYTWKDNSNIKSMTQGARSITYADNTAFCITDSVANLLPMPYIRMC